MPFSRYTSSLYVNIFIYSVNDLGVKWLNITMAITTLAELQLASATQYNTQSATDGTSLNTLRLNPTAHALATNAGVPTATTPVTTSVSVVSATSTVSSFVVGTQTVVLVEGPAGAKGDRGDQGLQGLQGPQGLPGVNVNPIPDAVGKIGEYLTVDNAGDLSWHNLKADVDAELATFKAQVVRQNLVNNIVFGS